MKILELDGKRYELVEIPEEPKPRKTGYERKLNDTYYMDVSGGVILTTDRNFSADFAAFESANYYADEQLAKDNARADALMRNLRRFSAEGRKRKIDWANENQLKFNIVQSNGKVRVGWTTFYRNQGAIYFDSKELVEAAIEKYRDELMWYFTQYQDTAEFREDVQTND